MGGLTALAVVVVAYALVASKLDRWWITAPMVFVAAGAILGPSGLNVLPVSPSNETVLTVTELTLALLLFSDASTVRLHDVEGDASLPNRLLFVGLPLTVVAGALVAHLMLPEVGWASAALIATILAPTDAALGLAVVTNRAVPVRIRRALNVESGLNDGIATPFVTLFIAVVAAGEGIGDQAWGLEALKQIGLAIVAAAVVGYIGGKLLAFANDHGWTSGVSEQIAILALALLAYEGAVAIGGNGFVAAFAGGILFGAATRGRLEAPGRFTETLGLSATFLVWSIFGALFVGKLFTHELSAQPIVYALVSLTVIRMVPVAIALIGTHLRPATVAFMGWFGPRGLASVVFTLIALEEFEHSGGATMLVETATWTILLSVVLHGISASPLAARYGAHNHPITDRSHRAPGDTALHHAPGVRVQRKPTWPMAQVHLGERLDEGMPPGAAGGRLVFGEGEQPGRRHPRRGPRGPRQRHSVPTLLSGSGYERSVRTRRGYGMAVGDAPVLEALIEINAASLARTELDARSLMLVRLAALAAVDAPASSYLLHVGPSVEAGLTAGDAEDVLVAVAPIVGAPRTASAAAKIMEALDLAIELAQEDDKSAQDA